LSTLLDYPEAKIRVIAPDIGGSFGVKQVYGKDVVAAVLALRTGRPVKWAATRTEDFMTTTQGRGAIDEAEATVTPDGRVTTLRVRIIHNMGADLKGYPSSPFFATAISAGLWLVNGPSGQCCRHWRAVSTTSRT
jgi:aerobic carbon-monoxide dehydrogenase large subunit